MVVKNKIKKLLVVNLILYASSLLAAAEYDSLDHAIEAQKENGHWQFYIDQHKKMCGPKEEL